MIDNLNTRYCEVHIPAGGEYVDIVQKPCSSCGLLDIIRNGFCETCDPKRRRLYEHARETRVQEVLDANNIPYLSRDKMVDNGVCMKYRPDFLFDAGSHFVVLEVDEHQHQSYACQCEQQRMVNISNGLGLPTTFVRFNPDKYIPGDNTKPKATKAREAVLIEWLRYLLETRHSPSTREAFCDTLYLFYDGHTHTSITFNTLISMERN